MKAFHTIAVPHKDILEGRLTMDIFAADLWEVTQKRGADEYKDPDTFNMKTYMTQGLKNLLSIVEKRLKGKGGDPVIQIQTPFGGGKTHALIAMYHKAKEWDVKRVVLVGTALSPKETLWGEIEEQLTGKIDKLSGMVAPGKEAIRKLLEENQPILILIDEVLEYVVKGAAVKIEDSTLANQTIAFIQELTETVSTLDKVSLVVTLPSSLIEHYDDSATRLYSQLQKVAGRVEKIYTPVKEDEITKIIRRRLFGRVENDRVKEVVSEFIKYAEEENMLPEGMRPSEYRDRFLESYPFMPEVVDILYHRWGSYYTFQRTRGVLRLLALVIYSLRNSNLPYISNADFDLSYPEILQELIKHISTEFNSVVASDITDVGAGAKKVDASLGDAHKGLKLGSRTATTIFIHSFSGGIEHGVSLSELKRQATTLQNPSSVIAEVIEQFNRKLFYLQSVGDRYLFTNQPNLNRILLTTMENIKGDTLIAEEEELLKSNIKGGYLKVYPWVEDSGSIPDSEELKLVILKTENKELMDSILKNKGQTPRVNRNTMFFLYPFEPERTGFVTHLKYKLAYEYIEKDESLNISDDQKKEIKKELKKAEVDLREYIRRYYQVIAIPSKDGFKVENMGIPTYGEDKAIDHEVYDKLRQDGEILEKIAPKLIKEKYLSQREFVPTKQLFESTLNTPGEVRMTNRGVFEEGIIEGVKQGLFGLGDLDDGKPKCSYYKEQASVFLSDYEVLITSEECDRQKIQIIKEGPDGGQEIYEEGEGIDKGFEKREGEPHGEARDKVELEFKVPKGKVADISRMMGFLQSRFNTLKIELKAKDGSISEQEYENIIEETLRQLGIEYEED